MFIGHYAPGFAAKALKHAPSLGAAFIAVQLVDFAWSAFVLTGVEHARITPGFLAMSDLELYDMPYTHSLVGALAWSALAAVVYRLIDRKNGWPGALIIGALVFSHWLLDLLVHAPDLALYPGGPKVGFGWWDNPILALGSELGLFALGFWLYITGTRAKNRVGAIAPWLIAALMLGALAYEKLSPPSADINAAAATALLAYTIIAALGFWLDAVRAKRA